MEPDRHPVSQTQESKIDPRLQEAATSSQPFSSAAPVEGTVSDYLKLPPPLPPHPVQHQHQHLPYGAPAPAPSPAPPPPPPWTQDGFNPYYPQVYSPFHDARGAPLQHPMQAPLPDIADTKRPRACEACRSLKVKCEVDADGGQCKRCAKAGRACMITGPSRKRQKKTDSKVAELERKIDALEQNLKSTKEGNVNSDDDGIYEEVDNTQRDTIMGGTTFQQTPRPSNASGSGKKRTFSDFQQGDYPRSYPPSFPTEVAQRPPPKAPFMAPEAQMGPIPTPRMASTGELPEAGRRNFGDADVVSRGILQMATADALFVHYTQNMAPHMPIVVFSQDTTSEAVRKSTPVLFLAILSVTSGQKLPGLQDALKKEIMHTLVDRVINGVSKSLEILQAIQVITVWYLPEPGKDSKYFQLVHMAAGMAIDLGINKKPKAKRNHFSVLQQDSSLIDTESIECRRAWLGSYLLYSSIAMGMRRPNLICNDGYLQECLIEFRLSEDPQDTDGTLCKLVYLQTLADDLSVQILPDDYTTISEAKVRSAHKGFERAMKEWQEQNKGNVGSSSLSLPFNVINLYMHELVMQHVANLEPGKSTSRSRGKIQSQAPSAQASSLSVALTSTLGIMDAFLKLDVGEIRTLPTFYFAQIAHASVSLIKMYFVAKEDLELGKHTPVTADVVLEYLGRLSDSLRIAGSESPSADTTLKMIVILRTLFGDHKDSTLASIKARYSGTPRLKGTQMIDLEEPQPTPQQRTAPRGNAETADDALHLLSAVAVGKTNADGYIAEEDRWAVADSAPVDGETAAMGQLIGEGEMGFMSDEGFIGIMQKMWARST